MTVVEKVIANLQSLIDEHKTTLTDDVYLQMSNSLMEAQKEVKTNTTNNFYEASIIVPKFIPANGSVVHFECHLRKHILRLSDKAANTYMNEIKEEGSVQMCNHCSNGVELMYQIYDTDSERYCNNDDEDEDSTTYIGNELQHINCEMHSITCIKLVKLN